MAMLICLSVCAIVWTARMLGGLERLELKAYDMLLRRQPRDERFQSAFLIVGIGETEYQKYGYPISDGQLAAAIENLEAAGPRAIGVDIVRNVPVGGAAGTEHLTRVLQQNENVVWAIVFSQWSITPPSGLSPENTGFAEHAPPDPDGVIRRLMISAKDPKQNKELASLNWLVALFYLSQDDRWDRQLAVPGDPRLVQLNKTVIDHFKRNDGAYTSADTGGYQFLPDYRGPIEFPRVSFEDVLQKKVRPEMVRDRIVLIGTTSDVAKDYVTTPLKNPQFGVDYHASCADTYLRLALAGAKPIHSQPDWGKAQWTLGWGLLGGVVGFRIRRLAVGLPIIFLGIVALTWIDLALLTHRHLWAPLVPPLLAWFFSSLGVMLYLLHLDRADRVAMEKLFSTTLPRPVFEKLWQQRATILKDGYMKAAEVTATVLFTDMKGFSDIAKSLRGRETDLMIWLNDYLRTMSKIIEDPENNGIIMTYMGDAIMAVFGAPDFDDPAKAATAAVRCALQMRVELERLRNRWTFPRTKELRMRVGIFTGPAVEGTLGSGTYLEYSVIGDTVNTASRLESHDKDMMPSDVAAYGCRILIGDTTNKLIDGRFKTRCLGKIEFAGVGSIVVHGVIQ
jgi:adenylate cyclase